ncbi:MAG: hypothetical protein OHK93_000896 [Ramalina farinacea]|uniref:Rhodopsin domain-containing protein n=1 Tax=Ramalina farinacea TaxID=258253 RepID=A0AA43QRR7_9LECA|nr:hypothetical protein [Ramalina farinacea]
MAAPQPPPGIDLKADKGDAIIGAVMACAVLSALAVIARLVSRRIMRTRPTVSDLLVIIALLCSWAISGLDVHAAKQGLGKHIYVVTNVEDILKVILFRPLPHQSHSHYVKDVYADQILYSIALTATRVSILLFYHSIFPAKTFTRLLWGIGALSVAWGLSVFFVAIFTCSPIRGFWQPMMQPPPHCINQQAFYDGLSVPNFLMDIAILALPVKEVWKLQMNTRTKMEVSGLFLLGGLFVFHPYHPSVLPATNLLLLMLFLPHSVVICSIVRLAFIANIDYVDFTFWSAAETHLAVVSACLPTLRPLAQKLLPSSLSHSLNKAFRSPSSKSHHEDPADFPSQGKEFQRLQDYHPSDGMARAEAGFGGRGMGRGERDRGDSLGEINVKSDIWVQQNLRESDAERFAGGAGGKSWGNAGV